MADLSTVKEAQYADQIGFDFIGTNHGRVYRTKRG